MDYLYAHVREMVTKEKRHDLSNLFILLNGIPKALNPVIDEFQEHVENLGTCLCMCVVVGGHMTYHVTHICTLSLSLPLSLSSPQR